MQTAGSARGAAAQCTPPVRVAQGGFHELSRHDALCGNWRRRVSSCFCCSCCATRGWALSAIRTSPATILRIHFLRNASRWYLSSMTIRYWWSVPSVPTYNTRGSAVCPKILGLPSFPAPPPTASPSLCIDGPLTTAGSMAPRIVSHAKWQGATSKPRSAAPTDLQSTTQTTLLRQGLNAAVKPAVNHPRAPCGAMTWLHVPAASRMLQLRSALLSPFAGRQEQASRLCGHAVSSPIT